MRYLIAILIVVSVVFGACEKDNGLPLSEVPIYAQEFFADNYPEASHVVWERYYNQYHVSFTFMEKGSIAKFTYSGDWLITQTPINYSDIPVVVLDSLRNSQFRNWVVSDQNLEDTPTNRKLYNEQLYRLVMYDNTKIKPLYYRPDGVMVYKSYYNTADE